MNKSLIRLIIPLFFEQLLVVSVGMVDTFMVSSVGEAAVSGVALVDNINRLVIQVMAAFAAGGVVIASQYYGSGNVKNTKHTAAQLEMLMNVFTVLAMFVLVFFRGSILSAIFGSVSEDVMEAALTYMLITAISYPFLGVYNAGSAILRSYGNTKISMYISVVMNIVNAVLNAVFVFFFNWGVAGVAIATLISRISAGISMKIMLMHKNNPLRVANIRQYIPNISYIKRILKIGVPSGIENGMFQIGKLMIVGLVATLGTNAIAANSVAYQIIDLPNLPGTAIGLALISVIGQDIGANNKTNAISHTKKLTICAYCGDWICNIFLFVFAPAIVSIFSLSPASSTMCEGVLRWFAAVSLFIWPLSFTLPNALRGAGDARYTMIISVGSMWLFRIVASYILVKVYNMGILGVWLGMFLDWAVRAMCFTTRFISKKWLNKRAI